MPLLSGEKYLFTDRLSPVHKSTFDKIVIQKCVNRSPECKKDHEDFINKFIERIEDERRIAHLIRRILLSSRRIKLSREDDDKIRKYCVKSLNKKIYKKIISKLN
jgi:hypothetical protein